ncbi:cardioacceleratory peptide receptor isoform X2 [Tetranychus urticae]|uniref:cardioacceleratory peptide receptor isoform X2 n=1 Tax=Tetranychus urticae TaxID=32264 RepID=UPI00077BD2A6|nr:cardioacceleratory peptide receptor isoform X2 [Tetranychus urticae]
MTMFNTTFPSFPSTDLQSTSPVDIVYRFNDQIVDFNSLHHQRSSPSPHSFQPSQHSSKLLLNGTADWSTNGSIEFTFNETEKDFQVYYFYQTEQLTFLWIIFVMIVFGNCSVLGTLLLSKGRKSRMNFFIMHLAIADLLVGLINVLTDIVWRFTVGFYTGDTACKAIKFAQVVVTYGSTYVLVALSIDRYDAITHPLNFTIRARRAKFLIAFAWTLSGIFSIPTLFLYKIHNIEDKPQCWIHLEPEEWQIYMTLVATSLFFIPTVIISACYSIIVHTIWTKSRLMGSSPRKKVKHLNGCSLVSENNCCSNHLTSNARFSGFESADLDFKRMSSRGVIPRAKIKTIKMTLVIIFVFILCWSPYFVWDLLQVYQQIPRTQTTVAISTFIQSLAPLNSAANPLIYCLFSTHVCRNFRKHSAVLWLTNVICFCLPRLYPIRGSTLRSDNNTLTSTYTRSSGRNSLSPHNRYQMATRNKFTYQQQQQSFQPSSLYPHKTFDTYGDTIQQTTLILDNNDANSDTDCKLNSNKLTLNNSKLDLSTSDSEVSTRLR